MSATYARTVFVEKVGDPENYMHEVKLRDALSGKIFTIYVPSNFIGGFPEGCEAELSLRWLD